MCCGVPLRTGVFAVTPRISFRLLGNRDVGVIRVGGWSRTEGLARVDRENVSCDARLVRIAVVSSTRWDSPWLSKQHLALALAESGHEVLYVDPPVSLGSVLRDRSRLGELRGGVEVVGAGVRVWRPRAVPGQDTGLGQVINARIVADGIRRVLGPADVTIAFGLTSRGALAAADGVRVYHCADSWPDHPGLDRQQAMAWEREMASAADLVVACSSGLVESLARREISAVLLPHGSTPELFADATPEAAIADLPRPIAGYAGGLNFRIDPALLHAALDAVGEGSVVLVGSSWKSARGETVPEFVDLVDHPRIHAVGHRTPADLPAALAAFDVGLVPYVDDGFNRCSFPLKVPQYLAAGLPVVSTPNGATAFYDAVTTEALGSADFRAGVEAAIDGLDDDAARARRVAAAASRPWRVVADELLALVAEVPR